MRIARYLKQVSLALMALGGMSTLQSGWAAGTPANTTISNTATVHYRVGTVDQTPITSAPATFVVDNKVDLVVAESGGGPIMVTPGATNVVATFTVTNTGNATQGYALSADNTAAAPHYGNGTGTDRDVTNVRVFVDVDNDGIFNPAVDTATNILAAAADATVRVFVVADVPLTFANNDYANVRLIAIAREANTLNALTESAGTDDPNTVQIVFADGDTDGTAARDATAQDEHRFSALSAALSITKSAEVVWDPFNLSANPKAVPGARVEYTVRVENTGSTAASNVVIRDTLPPETVFAPNVYAGSADVEIEVAGATTYCEAESGADGNGDGCYLNGAELVIGAPTAVGTINTGAGNAVTVRFQVEVR
jgi:uncharacterized repeat protein (TIGR01451 family)